MLDNFCAVGTSVDPPTGGKPYSEVTPKARPLSWVMKLVEEIYDGRYAQDVADLQKVPGEPAFVHERFANQIWALLAPPRL